MRAAKLGIGVMISRHWLKGVLSGKYNRGDHNRGTRDFQQPLPESREFQD